MTTLAPHSLRARISAGRSADRVLARTPEGTLDVARAAGLGPAANIRPDSTVLLCIDAALSLIETLVALDGHVAGLLLVSASATPDVVAALAEAADASLIISDRADLAGARSPAEAIAPLGEALGQDTVWMMTTSGTTGTPKIVPHTLSTLARTARPDPMGQTPVWGLIYEMTRFAGLQVALQSLIGGGTLVAAPRHAPMGDQVAFMAEADVTHLSATPTLWRRLLMVPGIERLPLKQVTLGGEIADQGVLDVVGARFPKARVTHIYASTETGVGFAVNDRKAGFPLSFLEDSPGGVALKIARDMLWVRPPGQHVARYVGGQVLETDAEGYILTGDQLEVDGDRAHFLGRESGVVNIGGVKVYPERVERTIAAVEGVALAAVAARKNPITGALLMATVVSSDPDAERDELKTRILAACRAGLEREAVPARITFAETLDTNAAGKIARS